MASGPVAQARSTRGILLRNIVSNWGAFAFSAIVNFFLSPYIVHRLGDNAYGVWALLVALVGYLGLLDLGVRSAVTRYVASFHSRAQHEDASRVASAALTIFCIAGALAIFVAAVAAAFLGSIFNIPPDLVGAARIVAVLGGINVAVSLVSGVFGGIVIGMQRLDLNNGIEVGLEALRATSIYLVLRAGYGLDVLALLQLIFSFARGVAAYWLSRRLYPGLRIRLGERGRDQLKMIFSFSIAASLMQASGMLILYSDSVVIGAFLPITMVTFFSIAVSLTNYARVFVSGISQAISPLASALEGGGQEDRVSRTLLSAASLATVIALPMVITFILRGHSFIDLWMGEEYGTNAAGVLWILSISLFVAAGYQINSATMVGIGKHRGLVPIYIGEAVVNIALCVILVRRYGIVGVAWGMTIPRIIVSVVVGPWYARRVVGIRIQQFWLRVWVRPMLAFVPFAVASYVVESIWPASSLLVYFTQIVATLPFGAVGVWFLCLPASARAEITRRVLRPAMVAESS